MFLLVGLGNPGQAYTHTRHNAGFLVLDILAREAGASFTGRQCQARVARIVLAGRPVLLAKPQTYMNLSGQAVAGLVHKHRIRLPELLILADDMDLPLGAIRLKRSGGSGGHHGLDSIIAALGTKDFARLRLGIGRPEGDAADFVLAGVGPAEAEAWRAALARAAEAARSFVRDGLDKAMNEYNKAPVEN